MAFVVLAAFCVLACVTPASAANVEPYEGQFKDVMDALENNNLSRASQLATDWLTSTTGQTEILALVAMGEVEERTGTLASLRKAARVYGSLIDFFPRRADMRRFAGERMERVERSLRALDVNVPPGYESY